MKVKATVTFEYSVDKEEIEKFKRQVLEYIEGALEEDEIACPWTLEDISDEAVEEFLANVLPDVIEEYHKGYDVNSGVMFHDYCNYLWFDYCGETVNDWVREFADDFMSDIAEE